MAELSLEWRKVINKPTQSELCNPFDPPTYTGVSYWSRISESTILVADLENNRLVIIPCDTSMRPYTFKGRLVLDYPDITVEKTDRTKLSRFDDARSLPSFIPELDERIIAVVPEALDGKVSFNPLGVYIYQKYVGWPSQYDFPNMSGYRVVNWISGYRWCRLDNSIVLVGTRPYNLMPPIDGPILGQILSIVKTYMPPDRMKARIESDHAQFLVRKEAAKRHYAAFQEAIDRVAEHADRDAIARKEEARLKKVYMDKISEVDVIVEVKQAELLAVEQHASKLLAKPRQVYTLAMDIAKLERQMATTASEQAYIASDIVTILNKSAESTSQIKVLTLQMDALTRQMEELARQIAKLQEQKTVLESSISV